MNREIKFRAWDTANKKWLFGYELLGGFNIIGEVVLMGELNSVSLEDWNNIEIMQYTGLQDKTGADIYEGDILNIGTVVFERGTFGVYPEYTDEFVPVAEWSSESRQIIGSIHTTKKRPDN